MNESARIYLRDVLGVTSFVAATPLRLIVFVTDEGLKHLPLIEKMMKAIELNISDYSVKVESELSSLDGSVPLLLMGSEMKPPNCEIAPNQKIFKTFGPEELLLNGALKKPAWEDLKRMKLELNW